MSAVEPDRSVPSTRPVVAGVPRPRVPVEGTVAGLHQRVRYPLVGTAVLTVTGEVDAATVGRFEEMLQSRLCTQLARMVLDLSGLGLLGVSGVRAVMAAELRARSSAAELVVVSGGNREITRALAATSGWHRLRWHAGPVASVLAGGCGYSANG